MPLFEHGLLGCTIETANSGSFCGSFSVSKHAAVFAGHYPNKPILPGAYLIEAGLQALEVVAAAASEPPPRLRGIDRFRLLRPILPGCVMTLRATCLGLTEAAGEVCWKHEVLVGDTLVARFRLIVGTAVLADGLEVLGAAREIDVAAIELLPSDIVSRLPHRWPILLIDHAHVLAGARRITTSKAVSFGEPCYADAGDSCSEFAYPRSLILESFTQSAALLMTEVLSTTGLMVFGGALRVHFHREVFPGEVISHKVVAKTSFDRYAMAGGVTLVGNQPVATFEGLSVGLINDHNADTTSEYLMKAETP